MKKLSLFLALVCLLALTATVALAETAQPARTYPDGTYRGGYIDPAQVEVNFVIKDGLFETIRYRALGYKGVDYLKSEDAAVLGITKQYNDLAEYLIGKDINALFDLYYPENITEDTDTFTAATLRSSKFISAINDGFNRGLYALPKAE